MVHVEEKVIVLAVLEGGMSKSEAARRYGSAANGYASSPDTRRGRCWASNPGPAAPNIIPATPATKPCGPDPGPARRAQPPGWTPAPTPSPATSTTKASDRSPPRSGGSSPPQGYHPGTPQTAPILLQRFKADQPNETWQSDFTHWALADGTDTEILELARRPLPLPCSVTAHRRVTGSTVIDAFPSTAAEHGYPASTLTDNGMVYTTRKSPAQGTANAFETLLALTGITQKNGRPYKPTTQGKIERFWQTLKKRLAAHPAATLTDLQHRLDEFRSYYNTRRPHRAINRQTPPSPTP